MNDVFWQKITDSAKSFLPFLLTLSIIFLSALPLRIPYFVHVSPALGLIPIYHWAIYRSNLLPFYSIFLLGLLQDVLIGTPLGFYTLIFLTMYGISLAQRRFFAGKAFHVYWFGFSVAALVIIILGWALASIWAETLLNFEGDLVQYAVLVGVFPIIASILLRLQQEFLQ
jgi:rod shape-determining protein MreD